MRDDHDAHALVQRYESMLAEDTRYFFDLEAFEQIIDHYKELHQYKEALNAAELALEQYPFSEELKFEKAQMLVYSNRLAEAMTVIEEIENNHLATCELAILKATLYMRYGDYHQAILLLEEALPEAEEPDEIHYRIGYARQQLQQFREASKEYKKAIALNLKLTHAVLELNECLDTIGEQERGIMFFKTFTDEYPFSPFAWYNLGLAYCRTEEFEQAREAFEYATLSDKNFTPAYREMGHIHMNAGEFTLAQQQYTQALEYDDNPDAYLLCCLGSAYERMGDFEAAIINYKEATRLDKFSEDAYFGIACCLFSQSRWFEAIMYLRKLVQMNPEHEEYWIVLGDTEYQLGNVLGAVDAYEKANAIFGQNPRLWLNWSLLYLEQGDVEQSFQIIEQGILECPQEASLYYRAVTYYICSGKFNEAVEKLEKALQLDYEGHTQLFDAFPDAEAQKTLSRIIQQIQDDEL